MYSGYLVIPSDRLGLRYYVHNPPSWILDKTWDGIHINTEDIFRLTGFLTCNFFLRWGKHGKTIYGERTNNIILKMNGGTYAEEFESSDIWWTWGDGIFEENLEGGGEMRETIGTTRTWLVEEIILKTVKIQDMGWARRMTKWKNEWTWN